MIINDFWHIFSPPYAIRDAFQVWSLSDILKIFFLYFLANWESAKTSSQQSMSWLECAGRCQKAEMTSAACNAFKYNDNICDHAKVFLKNYKYCYWWLTILSFS